MQITLCEAYTTASHSCDSHISRDGHVSVDAEFKGFMSSFDHFSHFTRSFPRLSRLSISATSRAVQAYLHSNMHHQPALAALERVVNTHTGLRRFKWPPNPFPGLVRLSVPLEVILLDPAKLPRGIRRLEVTALVDSGVLQIGRAHV